MIYFIPRNDNKRILISIFILIAFVLFQPEGITATYCGLLSVGKYVPKELTSENHHPHMILPHQSNLKRSYFDLSGYKALIITTSQSSRDKIDPSTGNVIKIGRPTGVYASEMTEPYYTFLDANMTVDIASISGGPIPIEKLSLRPLVRTKDDKRFLKDSILQQKVKHSKAINDIDISEYDIIFLSGGWGAAYDFAQSNELAELVSSAYSSKKLIGAVCHGPLGFIGARKPDGSPLVKGVKMTGVTNKQLKELMVLDTPKHPQTELINAGALYEYKGGLIHLFNNHIVVDENNLIVTGQNQKGGTEVAERLLDLLNKRNFQSEERK